MVQLLVDDVLLVVMLEDDVALQGCRWILGQERVLSLDLVVDVAWVVAAFFHVTLHLFWQFQLLLLLILICFIQGPLLC